MKLLEYRIDGDKIIIFGDTFRNKEKIKGIGASYEGQLKAWTLTNSEENEQLVKRLCETCNKKVDIEDVFKERLNATFPQFSKIKERTSKKKDLNKEELFDVVDINENSGTDTETATKLNSTDFTIYELLSGIEQTVRSVYEYPIWVVGEVQNISFSKSGIFFELVEAIVNSSGVLSVKTCIWNSDVSSIEERSGINMRQFLKDGLKLRVCARVNFYKARSYINLEVKDIDPNYTKGDLALKRQELVKKLKKDGHYYKNKELPLVKFPLKIGLISSYKSRAYSDFLHQLLLGGYPGQVIFFDARVQGEDSIRDIIQGIETLSEYGVYLIVVVRGGGSLSDLMWFDSEPLVYAVAQSSVPILSAIGHHDDQSVTEEVSYRREKTPTAAADFVLSLIEQVKDKIEDFATEIETVFSEIYERKIDALYNKRQELEQVFTLFISRCELKLKSKESSLIQGGMLVFYNLDSRIQKWTHLLDQAWLLYLNRQEATLDKFLFNIQKVDPRPWMKQGYTRLKKDSGGKIINISSVEEVSDGDSLEAGFIDGVLKLRVESKKKI